MRKGIRIISNDDVRSPYQEHMHPMTKVFKYYIIYDCEFHFSVWDIKWNYASDLFSGVKMFK